MEEGILHWLSPTPKIGGGNCPSSPVSDSTATPSFPSLPYRAATSHSRIFHFRIFSRTKLVQAVSCTAYQPLMTGTSCA